MLGSASAVTTVHQQQPPKQQTNMDYEDQFFEGCGKEGPIRCIFFSEFHPTAGPKITCQVPSDYVSKEVFDAVSVYIIPKQQLERSIITVNTLGHKITGYPVSIADPKYARNAFYFNLCFVCDAWARTVQYEPVVKKLAEYLGRLEEDKSFLSSEEEKKKLPDILASILEQLNNGKRAVVTEGENTFHLLVPRVAGDPPPVLDHHVPVFVEDLRWYRQDQWDLTTTQIMPYVDGFNHIAKIAADADVENNLVKACVQNLIYYGVVKLLPVFQYGNVYSVTPKLRTLYQDVDLQQECVRFTAKSERRLPPFSLLFTLYCGFNHGTTVRDLWSRHQAQVSGLIDERLLVQFGLIKGFLRRVEKYPVHIKPQQQQQQDHNSSGTGSTIDFAGATSVATSSSHVPNSLQRLCNGTLCSDEICCVLGISPQQLDEKIERDSSIVVIWK